MSERSSAIIYAPGLQSIPITDPRDPSRSACVRCAPAARHPTPALRAFWESYTCDRSLSPHELDGNVPPFGSFALLRRGCSTAALEEAQTLNRATCKRGGSPSAESEHP